MAAFAGDPKLVPCFDIGLDGPRDGSVTLALGADFVTVALRIEVCAPPYCVALCLSLSFALCCDGVRLVMPLEDAVRFGACRDPPVGLLGDVVLLEGELVEVLLLGEVLPPLDELGDDLLDELDGLLELALGELVFFWPPAPVDGPLFGPFGPPGPPEGPPPVDVVLVSFPVVTAIASPSP